MAVIPSLVSVCRCRTAAFIIRSVVNLARRMRFHRIRLAPGDVNAAAVGTPTGNARCKMLIRVRDALVIFFAEFVLFRIGVRIAPPPEILNEILTLFVRCESLKGALLLWRDDVRHVTFEPFLIRLFQFRLHVTCVFARIPVRRRLSLLSKDRYSSYRQKCRRKHHFSNYFKLHNSTLFLHELAPFTSSRNSNAYNTTIQDARTP